MENKENIVLIDVRSAEEYRVGHYPQSINIPLHLLENNLNKFNFDQSYIILCKSGARSEIAKNILIRQGFIAQNGGSWTNFEKIKNLVEN